MTDGDWPAPESQQQERPRLPLPRVDDLPVAEQGYDRDAVREAFDAFYRHAAQLDATLRTLEAVEVFQRTASELRAEMRTIRAGGWTVSSYGRPGYGSRGGGVREWSLPPAFPRIAAEAVFLIVIGVIVGIAGWSRIAIVLVMGLALAIVWLVELVASRERAAPPATAARPQAPKLDEEPVELPAAGEPEQGPEAMTILDAPSSAAPPEAEAAPEDTEEDAEPPAAGAEPEQEEPEEPEEQEEQEEQEPELEPDVPPEIQVTPSPIVLPGGAPPIPAPVPPSTDEPEPPAAAEAEAAALDAGDEVDEAPEAELALAEEVAPAAAADDDTLSGIEPLQIEPERRRFRLFRRTEQDVEPEPTMNSGEPSAVDAGADVEIDPWEQGPDLAPLAAVEADEAEQAEEAEEETEEDAVPERPRAFNISRARRRAPRRARRR